MPNIKAVAKKFAGEPERFGLRVKLGEYEVAYKQNNLSDKWQSAYNILRNSNATIKTRYTSEGYQFSYWLYGEDKIYRQKMKLKTPMSAATLPRSKAYDSPRFTSRGAGADAFAGPLSLSSI